MAEKAERELADIEVEEVSIVDSPAIGETFVLVKAVWSTAFVNDLPDSSFLHVAPGGKKDESGRTIPRSLRMFPYRDADGKVDLPHLRNALARIPQSKLSDTLKTKLTAKAQKLLGGSKVKKDDTFVDPVAVSAVKDEPIADPPEIVAIEKAEEAEEAAASSTSETTRKLIEEKLLAVASAAKRMAGELTDVDAEELGSKLSAMASLLWSVRDSIPVLSLSKSVEEAFPVGDQPAMLDKIVECIGQLGQCAARLRAEKTKETMSETTQQTVPEPAPAASVEKQAPLAEDPKAAASKLLVEAGWAPESVTKALEGLAKSPASPDVGAALTAIEKRLAAIESVAVSKAASGDPKPVEKSEDPWSGTEFDPKTFASR